MMKKIEREGAKDDNNPGLVKCSALYKEAMAHLTAVSW
jgi:hypothetical protein